MQHNCQVSLDTISWVLFWKAKEGDAFLERLPYQQQEEIERGDPWRKFSPYKKPLLVERHVWLYLVRLMTTLDTPQECEILSLILLDRLLARGGMVFCTRNLFPLITASYILACKYHQDCKRSLMDFHGCLSFFSLKLLKEMEVLFFRSVDYRLFVESSLYEHFVRILSELKPY
eukprot:TRINITY_DN7581_c0_g1_i5.p1 TRINITY_DN7581_c0_g1~~TRINITY_DN7581_c0_g1_i5.p1  ORF type:complete len:197 (-),score=22.74 TRINITY_DN7581_c0_g1_i5:86-607(-)